MNRGLFGRWMKRRMTRRLHHKLDLSAEQLAELMPIFDKMRTPGHFISDEQRAQFAQLLGSETLDSAKLNDLVVEKLTLYKKTLDEQAMALVGFMSGLDLSQRQKLQKIITSRHQCDRSVCRS